MKTLIITGSYKHSEDNIHYDITIFGQSDDNFTCTYITSFKLDTNVGYSELEDMARVKYAQYFQTDLFNIISLTNLIELK